jgi:hypothetical protein
MKNWESERKKTYPDLKRAIKIGQAARRGNEFSNVSRIGAA